ncbi:hypothetical protein ig2599ANME_0791 [groundwater metagenome]
MSCNQILDNLEYFIEMIDKDQQLFLKNRDLLESESKNIDALRPIYMNFNKLYNEFRDNTANIIVAHSELKDNERKHKFGDIDDDDFFKNKKQLKAKIVNSCTTMTEDIFPKLREFIRQISLSAPEDKKKTFEMERDSMIQQIEKEIEGKGILEKIEPYLKLLPKVIKKAALLLI